MDVKIESLISFNKMKTDVDEVFSIVDQNAMVLLLRENQIAYIIMKYDSSRDLSENIFPFKATNHKLHDAMKIVLLEAKDKTMHASKLADEIYNRRLYLKKDGSKAEYNQCRARAGKYLDWFETQPGNYIKLKDGIEK